MTMKKHDYEVNIEWTGNSGNGTRTYRSYSRDYSISANEKYDKINGSADPAFLGDKTKYNPEDLFLSSLSACHMLWYLHLCAVNDIVVTEYVDNATGVMQEAEDGSGRFVAVTLNPTVNITDANQVAKAKALHKEANKMCFIANSCNFAIKHQAKITVQT